MRTLWTVGHSTRPLDEFLEILSGQRIELLADVRRYPASRRHPQFNATALAHSLDDSGIRYEAYAELGGRRVPRPDSPNTRWRNASFRGYADYMETAAFRESLKRLQAQAAEARTAMMCAEAPWWRCHRALISDALKAHGLQVMHIMDQGRLVEHPYTLAARVVGGEVYYGPAGDLLDTRSDP